MQFHIAYFVAFILIFKLVHWFYQTKATECIDRRTLRPDSELIRDDPEEELVEEIALISEIRNVLKQTLRDIESQQVEWPIRFSGARF